MAKCWHIRSHDPASIASLQRAAGVSDVVAQLLICRGITDPAKARSFLDPKLTDLYEPESLPGCREAAQQIHAAVKARQRIVIYGDYDVDGMSGTAVLYLCLKLLGAEVSYYVPHRVDEGYGLNCEAVRSWGGRASLMITVDCGINCLEEAAVARQCGLELIVTDHHALGPQLPEAAAIVHPQLPGDYPFSGLSGSGVALKLAWALCQQASGARKVSPPMRDFLVQAVGLAAVGTVADVVPLVDENRVLVHYGLESLARCPTLGLATLMKIAKVQPKTNGDGRLRLDSEDIGFALAPRLNAAGRLARRSWAWSCWSPIGPTAPWSWPSISISSTAAARRWSEACNLPPQNRSTNASARATSRPSCWPSGAGMPASSASWRDGWPKSIIAPWCSSPWTRWARGPASARRGAYRASTCTRPWRPATNAS